MRFIEPVSLSAFDSLIADIDFGSSCQDEFALSVKDYIGHVNPRKTVPPEVWELRIAYDDIRHPYVPVGVIGWYNWPITDEKFPWLSWFGVRKQFQGQGYGKKLLWWTVDELAGWFPKAEYVYVFTDTAKDFYTKGGFQYRGKSSELTASGEIAPDATFDTGTEYDILRKKLTRR